MMSKETLRDLLTGSFNHTMDCDLDRLWEEVRKKTQEAKRTGRQIILPVTLKMSTRIVVVPDASE